MKVKIQQFLRQNHSWALVGWNITQSLIKMGHEVHLIPTDIKFKNHMPDKLKIHLKDKPDKDYDAQISYTAMINFPEYLKHGSKNRFGIWNYEYLSTRQGTGLPGFGKYHKFVDKFLPSSTFSKEVFAKMGIPEEHMVVVPHGIQLEDFENKNKWNIKTDKNIKILLNIAQPHKRKAIHLALAAFGEAFSKDDDVCLVAKISTGNKSNHLFDVDFHKIYRDFEHKYPKHAEVKIITEFIPNIVELYNSCDLNFSATHCECWHLPSLEALAAGLVNVVPRYGGLLDFCNDNNSILMDGKIRRAPKDHQYWNYSSYAGHFVIDVEDAAKKLKYAVDNVDELREKFLPEMRNTANKFTWDNAVSKILELCE